MQASALSVNGLRNAPSNHSSTTAPTQLFRERGYIKRKYNPATTFNPEDMPPEDRGHWRWLKKRDHGWKDSDCKASRRAKFDTVMAIISKLRLPDCQERSAADLAMSIDARKFSSYGGTPALALAAASISVNKSRQEYPDFTLPDKVEEDEEFQQLLERLDVDFVDARKKLKILLM